MMIGLLNPLVHHLLRKTQALDLVSAEFIIILSLTQPKSAGQKSDDKIINIET